MVFRSAGILKLRLSLGIRIVLPGTFSSRSLSSNSSIAAELDPAVAPAIRMAVVIWAKAVALPNASPAISAGIDPSSVASAVADPAAAPVIRMAVVRLADADDEHAMSPAMAALVAPKSIVAVADPAALPDTRISVVILADDAALAVALAVTVIAIVRDAAAPAQGVSAHDDSPQDISPPE